MNTLASEQVLRPAQGGLGRWVMGQVAAAIPLGFWILRRVRPIARFGSTYIVTLHDDVREVLGTDEAFDVPYGPNLSVITDGEPFFLGMTDTAEYRAAIDAMRRVVRMDDLPRIAKNVESQAEAIVAGADGRVEVVDQLVRRVTFDVLAEYFGVPAPPKGRLDVWATRLFEFQFAGSPMDLELREQVNEIAPAFRAHIDDEIARRKAGGTASDDVLTRCLALQTSGVDGFTDVQIRTAVLCMLVGGPPQPPMVVPQAMEQLLRRPEALSAAAGAARANEDVLLHNIVREAMRFDPLAPGLKRIAIRNWTVARGTRREQMIPMGATVFAGFASAMRDERRIPSPSRFDHDRRSHEYIHYGHGLHECFGRHINTAILHMMLKPLLKRPGLRRAPGSEGHLTKNGIFAEKLVVEFD